VLPALVHRVQAPEPDRAGLLQVRRARAPEPDRAVRPQACRVQEPEPAQAAQVLALAPFASGPAASH
jgi:hypothetical protein